MQITEMILNSWAIKSKNNTTNYGKCSIERLKQLQIRLGKIRNED